MVIFVLLANPFHQKAFVVTATEGYVRGPLLSVFYAVSLLYSLVGTFYLIYSFRFLRLGKWLALMSMYILSFAGIFIQLFFPNVLIEIFSTAIALLLIILMVLRPEEITDTNVGLPSWKAYRDELYKITRIHRPVQIDVIKFINATEVREYLGEEKFNAYIEKCKALSFYETGLTAEYGDKLLTLSTCEYTQNNGRFVVVAKQI